MRNPSSTSTKTITPCCSKVRIKRGPWTPEEDELLTNYVRKEGEGRWRTLPNRAGLLRCGKSCRLRWMNYLRPDVKRGRITPDEEDLILRLHRLLGNRWSLIAGRIPGRTDNEIKNYWNIHLSKKLISQGIDPTTHKPLDPNLGFPPQVSNSTSLQLQGTERIHGTAAAILSEDFTMTNVDGHQNQILDSGTQNRSNCNGTLMGLQNGHGQNSVQDCNIGNIGDSDDALNSFLDSLMNDNTFLHQQLQPFGPFVQPLASSEEAFNQPVWDEVDFITSMAAFGDKDGS